MGILKVCVVIFFSCLLPRASFSSDFNSNFNIAIGDDSLHYGKTGIDYVFLQDNIAIGRASNYRLSNGSGNIGIGSSSLRLIRDGSYNLAIGSDTLHKLVSGSNNIALGYDALHDLKNGSNNISIGHHSSYVKHNNDFSLKNDSNNILIGAFSGKKVNKKITNSIAIGYRAAVDESNQIVLGNDDVTSINIGGIDFITITYLLYVMIFFNFLILSSLIYLYINFYRVKRLLI